MSERKWTNGLFNIRELASLNQVIVSNFIYCKKFKKQGSCKYLQLSAEYQ